MRCFFRDCLNTPCFYCTCDGLVVLCSDHSKAHSNCCSFFNFRKYSINDHSKIVEDYLKQEMIKLLAKVIEKTQQNVKILNENSAKAVRNIYKIDSLLRVFVNGNEELEARTNSIESVIQEAKNYFFDEF